MHKKIPSAIYTTQFWLVCLSSALFFASFNMMLPELPAYLSALGGGEHKGLIISLFTITAMASRPFSGKLSDTIGRVPVMLFGSAVCLVCSLLYPFLTSVSGFLLLRLVHGFSTGFTPTGLTAYLSDVIPAEKRGEAMGVLGAAGTTGMAAGPALGGAIANTFSMNTMFYTSSFLGLVSILVLFRINETLKHKKKISANALKIQRHDFFEPLVLIPCIIMILSAYSYGAMFTVLPDLGEFVGIKNKGVLFTFLTVASLLVRLLGSRVSDYYGRVRVLMVSTFMIAVGMTIIGLSTEPTLVIVGVTIYGMAQGITSPTLFAWATDLSHQQYKGRGIASLYIFMEAGIGIGAFISGVLYGNNTNNFLIVFMLCASLSTSAFIYLCVRKKPIAPFQ